MLNKLCKVDIKNVAVNKKNRNNVIRRSIAAITISILCLNLAVFSKTNDNAVRALTNAPGRLAYVNDNDHLNQTRLMMDGNNFLKNGFWMHTKLTALDGDVSTPASKYSAAIEFTIPGYDISNLRFFVFDKNFSRGGAVSQHIVSNPQAAKAEINLTDLKQTTYEVHVYDGALEEDRFICKAEFCVTNNELTGGSGSSATTTLRDANNQKIQTAGQDVSLKYYKQYAASGAAQTCLELPANLIPYNAKTIKVVFFAADRNGEPVNIDQTLYDYVSVKGAAASDPAKINFYPEGSWGTNADIKYEAHFYKDEVEKANFICKADGITLQG